MYLVCAPFCTLQNDSFNHIAWKRSHVWVLACGHVSVTLQFSRQSLEGGCVGSSSSVSRGLQAALSSVSLTQEEKSTLASCATAFSPASPLLPRKTSGRNLSFFSHWLRWQEQGGNALQLVRQKREDGNWRLWKIFFCFDLIWFFQKFLISIWST